MRQRPVVKISIDPYDIVLNEGAFYSVFLNEWRDFYGTVYEKLLPNQPELQGKSVLIICFIDVDHKGNFVTPRSHTRIFV